MNDLDRSRCVEFAQLFLGNNFQTGSVNQTIDECGSFSSFRVRFISESVDSIESTRQVVTKWRESIQSKRQIPNDKDDLTHTIELLVVRQGEIERLIKESTADMLEKLRAIDSLATIKERVLSNLSEVNDLIFQFQKQLKDIEEAKP